MKFIVKNALIKYGSLVIVLALLGLVRLQSTATSITREADSSGAAQEQKALPTRPGSDDIPPLFSVEKSVTPEGEVRYSEELTYTVVISAPFGTSAGFYDPLRHVTFQRFVEQPPGITYTQIISEGARIGVVTGTLALNATSPVTVSFVVRVDAPATLSWLTTVTNRAGVCLLEGTLNYCIWSNEVSNIAYHPFYSLYLPHVKKGISYLSGYYVDCVAGKDSNAGTSPGAAWRTLAPVQAASLGPGDVVHLKRGCTWTGGLVIKASGAEGNPLTFTAYGEGARPVLRDAPKAGIDARGSWLVLRDLEITDVCTGIFLRGHHSLVTQCYIHDTRGCDWAAVGIWLLGPYHEISYNRLERCIAPSEVEGIDGGGLEWFGDARGCYVHHNWVQDSDGFLEVGADAGAGSASDSIVAYNVSLNNNGKFSLLSLEGARWASEVNNFRVEHNTIVEYAHAESKWAVFRFVGEPTPATLSLENNIVYAERFWRLANRTDFSHSYNLYYLNAVDLGFALGPGEILADPRFVDLEGRDFRLQADSPAVDGGIDLGHTEDFEGNRVPINEAPDLGAFEFTGLPEFPPTPTPTPSPTPLPTPGPDEIIIDDADPGFSTSFSQDDWQQYTYIGGQHYGDTHYYNEEIGTGEDTATWTFTVPEPGSYEVYAWWWAGSWRPTDVPYTINHLNGSTKLRVNQQIDGARWNLLGTFEFQDQGSVMVSDDVSSGQDVAADAVRLVYLAPLASIKNLSASNVALASTPAPSLMPLTPTPTPTCDPARVLMTTDVPAASPPESTARGDTPTSQPVWILILVALLKKLRQKGVF